MVFPKLQTASLESNPTKNVIFHETRKLESCNFKEE